MLLRVLINNREGNVKKNIMQVGRCLRIAGKVSDARVVANL